VFYFIVFDDFSSPLEQKQKQKQNTDISSKEKKQNFITVWLKPKKTIRLRSKIWNRTGPTLMSKETTDVGTGGRTTSSPSQQWIDKLMTSVQGYSFLNHKDTYETHFPSLPTPSSSTKKKLLRLDNDVDDPTNKNDPQIEDENIDDDVNEKITVTSSFDSSSNLDEGSMLMSNSVYPSSSKSLLPMKSNEYSCDEARRGNMIDFLSHTDRSVGMDDRRDDVECSNGNNLSPNDSDDTTTRGDDSSRSQPTTGCTLLFRHSYRPSILSQPEHQKDKQWYDEFLTNPHHIMSVASFVHPYYDPVHVTSSGFSSSSCGSYCFRNDKEYDADVIYYDQQERKYNHYGTMVTLAHLELFPTYEIEWMFLWNENDNMTTSNHTIHWNDTTNDIQLEDENVVQEGLPLCPIDMLSNVTMMMSMDGRNNGYDSHF
jgi:hypothetical protein